MKEWSLTYVTILDDPIFVVGDDTERIRLYEQEARLLGARVQKFPTPAFAEHDSAARAFVDLQRLAACKKIVLVGKFSSFALSASLMGSGRLIVKNNIGDGKGNEHRNSWAELGTISIY